MCRSGGPVGAPGSGSDISYSSPCRKEPLDIVFGFALKLCTPAYGGVSFDVRILGPNRAEFDEHNSPVRTRLYRLTTFAPTLLITGYSGTQTAPIDIANMSDARAEYDTVEDHRLNRIIASD